MLNLFRSHHASHIRSSGRIADVSGSSANQRDRLISCLLQTFHQTERHEMSDMKAVCRRVKPNVKNSFPIVHQISDSFLIRHLGNQPACLKFFVNSHLSFSLIVFFELRSFLFHRKALSPETKNRPYCIRNKDGYQPWYHLNSPEILSPSGLYRTITCTTPSQPTDHTFPAFGAKLRDVFTDSVSCASHQPAAFCLHCDLLLLPFTACIIC